MPSPPKRKPTNDEREEALRRASFKAWGASLRPNVVAPSTPEFDTALLKDKPVPLRMLTEADIVCDAGTVAEAGRACHCRVTDSLIVLDKDPASLQAFCLNPDGYAKCPVKIDDRERAIAGRKTMSVRG